MRAMIMILGMLFLSTVSAADDLANLLTQTNSALKAGDYPALEADLGKLLQLRPGYPRYYYLLALARSHRGDRNGALEALGYLADIGVYTDLDKGDDFGPLQSAPGYAALQARLTTLRKPVGHSDAAFHLDEPDFIPEGLSYDPGSGDFFVASVHLRKIVRFHAGASSLFADRSAGLWSVLWAVSSALPQMQDYDAKLDGRTALFRFDLKSGALLASYAPPADGATHLLNDLCIGPDGSVYAADGAGGVYRLTPGASTLTPLTPAGTLHSAQGLAVSPDGHRLYLADYTGGLYAYDLVRSELKRLVTPANVYTYYVDALALHGRDLVAVQNEVDPQRVVRFRLDDSGLVITSAEVLDAWDSLVPEPTLAALVGDRLYLVSNSQWRRFDENGKLPPPDQLQPPLIVSLSLP